MSDDLQVKGEDQGVPASPSGCQPSASAASADAPASSQSGIPNAVHTPLPWTLSYGFSLSRISTKSAAYVAPSSPEPIGIKLASPWIEGAWDYDEEAAANAEFIVRACNSHYDLCEALRELLVAVRFADPPRDFGTDDEPNLCHEARVPVEFVTIAERALAKASGIEAAAADETRSGSAEGESPVGDSRDARPIAPPSNEPEHD